MGGEVAGGRGAYVSIHTDAEDAGWCGRVGKLLFRSAGHRAVQRDWGDKSDVG